MERDQRARRPYRTGALLSDSRRSIQTSIIPVVRRSDRRSYVRMINSVHLLVPCSETPPTCASLQRHLAHILTGNSANGAAGTGKGKAVFKVGNPQSSSVNLSNGAASAMEQEPIEVADSEEDREEERKTNANRRSSTS